MCKWSLPLCLLMLSSVVLAAPVKSYDWIAKERIRGGYMSAANLGPGQARMKSVGMNLLMPKFGGLQATPTEDNIKLLRQWGEAAKANGLHLMPVFNVRGGETEKLLNDRREVTAGGQVMKRTPCPLDEAFWTRYLLGRSVWLAQHAKELGLDGAIIDPEMYGSDHTTFNTACYCDDCLREFLKARGQAVPEPLPAPAQRLAWLKEQKLEAAYTDYFVSRVQAFSQQIEQQVHAANPDFVLGVLLLDYPLPFMKGMAMGMGTEERPVLAFSETTYSPGYTDYVPKQQAAFAAMPAHVLLVPGLWQQQFPSGNLAEQYYACAAASAGYWIYTYESLLEDVSKSPGYALREPEDRYWDAMRTANTELDKLARDHNYQSVLKVRPYDPPLPVLGTADIPIPALQAAPDDKPLKLGPPTQPRLRNRNPLAIVCRPGEPVKLKVTNLQLASYTPGTQWAVVGPDGKRLREGRMKVKESQEISFTPERDGTYLLVADSGQNSYAVQVLSSQPYGLFATRKHYVRVNGQFGRMYFYVPQVEKFSLLVKAEGQAAGRGGKLTVYGPDGQAAAHLEGDLGSQTELAVNVPAAQQGRVWCLSAEDVTNDLTVSLSDNVPGYFSPDPARVVTVQR